MGAHLRPFLVRAVLIGRTQFLIWINAALGKLNQSFKSWLRSWTMRAAWLAIPVVCAIVSSAEAESRWLEAARLHASEIGSLCERVQGIRLLARMQIIASGDDRWRRLSRQELVIEDALMGVPPLDPDRCYVIARAGAPGESERRAFEVRDFALSTERTSVFIVGRAYDPPPIREESDRHH